MATATAAYGLMPVAWVRTKATKGVEAVAASLRGFGGTCVVGSASPEGYVALGVN
jgi:hypothetical protein